MLRLEARSDALQGEIKAFDIQVTEEEQKADEKSESEASGEAQDDSDEEANDDKFNNAVFKKKEEGFENKYEIKELTPKDLLKENKWSKIIEENMKQLIDEQIKVLRMDYKETQELSTLKDSEKMTTGTSDGT